DTFDDLPIHPLILEAIRTIGWATPTPVQKLCLPFSLRGRDVAGFAQTGTGKTAVFLITILNKLLNAATEHTQAAGRVPRAIVIAPTREL
ncbi:DEAD/DEAH box helicase, partial [Klebsiella pneumoniae]